ncbi:uncharacterized protein LOC134786003 [Penaeus indicus]|uniref:uncharacterized protein LOC134786003 n=1 Tax=Penaeus indicus TaxID=29960 RepID=UPI00300D0C29
MEEPLPRLPWHRREPSTSTQWREGRGTEARETFRGRQFLGLRPGRFRAAPVAGAASLPSGNTLVCVCVIEDLLTLFRTTMTIQLYIRTRIKEDLFQEQLLQNSATGVSEDLGSWKKCRKMNGMIQAQIAQL